MAYVSDYESATSEYLSAIYSDVDSSSFRAVMSVLPEEAESPTFTYSGDSVSFPGYEDLEIDPTATGMRYKVATFENNRIKLDGGYSFPFNPFTDEYIGKWWYPTNNVVITATIPSGVSIPGVSIVFDDMAGEYASHIKVDAYNGNTLLTSHVVVGNDTPTADLLFPIDNATKIVVTVYADSWEGGYYIKVSALHFGLVKQFAGADVFSFEMVEEGSLFDTSLNIPQATLTVDNSGGEFSIFSDSSLFRYLQKRMLISCYITVADMEILMCAWRLYAWTADDENMIATFTLRPTVGFEQKFTSVSMNTDSLDSVAALVGNKIGIGDLLDDMPSRWGSMEANVYFGEGVNAESGMQIIANSGGAFWDVTREDTYRVVDEWRDGKDTGLFAARMVRNDDLLSYPDTAYIFPLQDYVINWQSKNGDSMESHDYTVKVSSDTTGATDYVYAQCLSTQAQVTTLANNYYGYFLRYDLTVKAQIKGDPLLRPYDKVTVKIGDTWQEIVITKITHKYGAQIMTSDIEGIGMTSTYIG